MKIKGRGPEDRLLAAVQNYVVKRGGSLIVVGGIEIQDWHEGKGKFKLAVRCLGRRPTLQGEEGK